MNRPLARAAMLAALVALVLVGVLSPFGEQDLPVPPAAAEEVPASAAPAPTAPVGTPPAEPGPTPSSAVPSPAVPTPAPAAQDITLAFGGDVHFEGPVGRALLRDPSTVLGAAARPLREADVAVVNLETAVGSGTPEAKTYAFSAPPAGIEALGAAGVDVLSLANNHALDQGPRALARAVRTASSAGLATVGAGEDEDAAFRPFTTDVRGTRVTVLAATQVLDSSLAARWTAGPGKPGVASAKDPSRLLAEVAAAREAGGLVVVYLHWGRELDRCPPEQAQDLAGQLAEAGADVVVGTHAHVRLADGYLGRTYVHYGLGNLLWYRGGDDRGGVVSLTVRGRDVVDTSWLPIRMRGAVPVAAPDRGVAPATQACSGLEPVPAAP